MGGEKSKPMVSNNCIVGILTMASEMKFSPDSHTSYRSVYGKTVYGKTENVVHRYTAN